MALTRTQINLSEAQRSFLRRLARRRGTSISEVLRSVVDEMMAAQPAARRHEEDPFFQIIGMASGRSGPTSERIDEIVYRKDWE